MSKFNFLFQSTHFRSAAISQLVFQQHGANYLPLSAITQYHNPLHQHYLLEQFLSKVDYHFEGYLRWMGGQADGHYQHLLKALLKFSWGQNGKTIENFQSCLVDYLSVCSTGYRPIASYLWTSGTRSTSPACPHCPQSAWILTVTGTPCLLSLRTDMWTALSQVCLSLLF